MSNEPAAMQPVERSAGPSIVAGTAIAAGGAVVGGAGTMALTGNAELLAKAIESGGQTAAVLIVALSFVAGMVRAAERRSDRLADTFDRAFRAQQEIHAAAVRDAASTQAAAIAGLTAQIATRDAQLAAIAAGQREDNQRLEDVLLAGVKSASETGAILKIVEERLRK